MIRYLEDSPKATTSNGRASEDAKYKDPEKKLHEATAAGRPARTGRPTTPRLRTTDQGRTSDDHQPPDDRSSPDIRTLRTRAESTDDRSHQTSDDSKRPDDRQTQDVRHSPAPG